MLLFVTYCYYHSCRRLHLGTNDPVTTLALSQSETISKRLSLFSWILDCDSEVTEDDHACWPGNRQTLPMKTKK